MTTAELVARSRSARAAVDAAIDAAEAAADELIVRAVAVGTVDPLTRGELAEVLDRAAGERAAIIAAILGDA